MPTTMLTLAPPYPTHRTHTTPRTPGPRLRRLRTLSLAALALLAGCTTTRNERPWIGQPESGDYGVVYLDAVRPAERPETPMVDDKPSVFSLSREWEPVVLVTPPDGVAAHRTYAYEHFLTRDTARQRGEPPTALSAIELSGDTRAVQAVEGPYNALIAFVDGLLIPARAITHSPWREVYTFSESYWRGDAGTLRRPPGGDAAGAAEPLPRPPKTVAPDTGSTGDAPSAPLRTEPAPSTETPLPPTTIPPPAADPLKRPEVPR